MDIATIIGFVLGTFLLVGAIVLTGSPMAFVHVQSMMITIGGTIAATAICFPIKSLTSLPHVMKNAFLHQDEALDNIVDIMVEFALVARREGVLALEKQLNEISNEFVTKGVQLAVDGTEEDLTRAILETELDYVLQRHSQGQRIFEKMGEFAPGFGMIGTLIGLISMALNLDDPSAIGPGMATALITTFYGSLMSNFIFLPIASKLKLYSEFEELEKSIVLEGVSSIQAGENPRLVKEKLQSFIPKNLRKEEDGQKAA